VLSALNLFAGSGVSRREREQRRASVQNILVVELWNIGDVVLTIPFLAQLRAIFPGARITLLARPHARPILEGTGLVDEILDDADPGENWLSLNPFAHDWRNFIELGRALRARKFDIAFQSRMHVREHVILAMSGARRRVGFAFRENDRVLTDAIRVTNPHRHKVDDWMQLLEPFGGAVVTGSAALHISAEEQVRAKELLMDHGVDERDTLIGIHPGASLEAKRWPLERFVEVAEELTTYPDCRVIGFVDPAGYGARLGDVSGVIIAQTALREMMALIARCDVLLCNDSGPMHIAGALGIRAVALFGTGIARWFAPLGENHVVVSADETQTGVLQDIPASRVLAALDDALSPYATARGGSTPAPGKPRP